MFKLYILSLLSLCSFYANAQQYELKAAPVPGKNAVQLKWFSKTVDVASTFNIYRKTGSESNWTKLNTAVIAAAKPVSGDDLKTKKYSNAVTKYSVIMNMSEEDKKVFVQYLNAQIVTDNELAQLTGNYFTDENVNAGTIVSYRLMLLTDGKETDVADTTFTYNAFVQQPAPAGFAGKGGDKKIFLKWKYTAAFPVYHVYRTTISGGKADTAFSFFPGEAQIDSAKNNRWMFTDNDSILQEGKKYFYKISGVDYFGNETVLSAEISVSPVDLTPPLPVNHFISEMIDDGKNVKLTWHPGKSPDLKDLNVYRGTSASSSFTKLNTTPLSKADTSFIDKTTTELAHYIYYIESEDNAGNKSSSVHIELTMADITPPAVPTGLHAVSDSASITISWNRNTEKDLRGYFIFSALKTDETNFNLLTKDPITGNSWNDNLPKNISSKFYYKVCAVDSSWNRSANTAPISAKMPDRVAPPGTFLKTISYANGKATLTWAAVHDPGIKSYFLYRKTDSMATSLSTIFRMNVPGTDTMYVDQLLEPGKKYYYCIGVEDSAGNRSPSSGWRMISTENNSIPAAPTNVRAVYDKTANAVTISWLKTEGLRYQVFKSTNDGSFLPVTSLATASSFSDKDIAAGNHYAYKVAAFNSNEDMSAFSDAASFEIK